MQSQIWLAFVTASTAFLPTVLLVLDYAMTQGKRVAVATVGGIVLGGFVAMSASLGDLEKVTETNAVGVLATQRL